MCSPPDPPINTHSYTRRAQNENVEKGGFHLIDIHGICLGSGFIIIIILIAVIAVLWRQLKKEKKKGKREAQIQTIQPAIQPSPWTTTYQANYQPPIQQWAPPIILDNRQSTLERSVSRFSSLPDRYDDEYASEPIRRQRPKPIRYGPSANTSPNTAPTEEEGPPFSHQRGDN